MKLTFWGATRQVTGSMYLLELEDGYKILIECGNDMENPQELTPAYPGSSFPFEPSQLNLVVLTHAHLDHSGKVPNLFREGYEGQVLCTPPTFSLSELLLHDAANLNREKLNKFHRIRQKKGGHKYQPRFNPGDLYMEKDVDKSLERFVTINFNRRFNVHPGVHITLIPTGHLLGAANVFIEVEEGGTTKTLLFSGDIGRFHYPLLPDPEAPPVADYIVCETTYGNRRHTSIADSRQDLLRVIRETCVDRPGRLIIPAFSIGRTQAVIYTLNQLFLDGHLPPVKVFADSPLAMRSNMVYEKYYQYLNQEAKLFRKENGSLFDFETLHYVDNPKESKTLSNYAEPCIIISASGMLEGGRIQHHIQHNIQNPYCTILMVGFSAEGTFGHRLLHSNGKLTFGNKEMVVSAKIEQTDSFSGHGDLDDLLGFVRHQPADTLKNVFLVHGEESSMEAFRRTLAQEGYPNVTIPTRGQTFDL